MHVTNKQIRSFFQNKENVKHPLTDKLIQGGYKQRSGGYIKTARLAGVENPTQYWHLLSSWCAQSPDDAPFNKRIQCGELIFWMAEVSGAVSKKRLGELCEQILKDYVNNRRKGNRIIQNVCFDEILRIVSS